MDAMIQSRMEMAVDPTAAFDQLLGDLTTALERYGLAFEAGPQGRIVAGPDEVARIVAWQPGERLTLAWGKAYSADAGTEIEIQFESYGAGTVVKFEVRNWTAAMGPWVDASGWFASQIAAPLVHALAPGTIGDWITDRAARRPSGRQARATYRDPLYHYPAFRVILDELVLRPGDFLLDVGCGGGAFLRESLKSGCRAFGVDHSLEMVRVARETNETAIADGRLQVVQARAERLPLEVATFTCAAMTGVLGFLPDPVASLVEIRQALKPGGRLVILGSDPKLRGTPAAPEPIASRLRFYEDGDLKKLGDAAGFEHTVVVRRDLESHAREVGVPEEHLPLFAGLAPFLVARRS